MSTHGGGEETASTVIILPVLRYTYFFLSTGSVWSCDAGSRRRRFRAFNRSDNARRNHFINISFCVTTNNSLVLYTGYHRTVLLDLNMEISKKS